jgi:hypothetical protein
LFDVLSLRNAGLLGREGNAGWLSQRGAGLVSQECVEEFSPRSGRQPVAHGASRGSAGAPTPAPSPAKRGRGAEGGVRAIQPRAFALGYSMPPLAGLRKNGRVRKTFLIEKNYVRSQYVIENKGTHCRNELKRTHFERQMCRLNPQIELSLHTPVRAGGPCRKHTARFDKEPARGTPQNPRKCKNSGNKAKKLLKTKEVSFKTNLRETNFVPQTSVLIRCFNQSRIEATRGAGPCRKWFDAEPNRGALQSAEKYKNRGNELKDLLQRQGITEIAASKRTHFRAERAVIGAERSGISRIVGGRLAVPWLQRSYTNRGRASPTPTNL